jgi:antitoxin component YwqK of YwqJK toxin-antitoxin module
MYKSIEKTYYNNGKLRTILTIYSFFEFQKYFNEKGKLLSENTYIKGGIGYGIIKDYYYANFGKSKELYIKTYKYFPSGGIQNGVNLMITS